MTANEGTAKRASCSDEPAMRELPILDESRCTGCSACVDCCPTACLALAGPLPWLPRPLDCVACELCVWVCPVNALEMSSAGGS